MTGSIERAGTLIFIGVGSNLGDSTKHVRDAFEALKAQEDIHGARLSPLYLSKAVGPGDQADYVNAAIQFSTHLSALDLLALLQSIENQHGRIRHERWGARTLDLDILLYGDQIINNDTLTVPHPRMTERNFVLAPLLDLQSKLVLPNGVSVASLLESVGLNDLSRIRPDN